MLKISHFSPLGCCACAKILSDSQRFDPRARVRKKENMFKHGVQLSDRQDFPQSIRNLDRKIALWRAENAPVASIHTTISLEPNLGFPQVQTFKGEGSASFLMVPRTSKTDVEN